MFRNGIVSAQDVENCRVRVQFPERDQMVSWWLPVVQTKTYAAKAFHMPAVGEQVVCLMDARDEDGAVLGAIYSTADPTPAGLNGEELYLQAEDGAIFQYDPTSHKLSFVLTAGGSFTVTANGAEFAIDALGNVTINTPGLITLAGGGPAIARVGDATTCPAGQGKITSGSAKVISG